MPQPIYTTLTFDASDREDGFTLGELRGYLNALVDTHGVSEEGKLYAKIKMGRIAHGGSMVYGFTVVAPISDVTKTPPTIITVDTDKGHTRA